MKKLIYLPIILFSTIIYSQCNISGKNTINNGDTATYNVDTEIAQCKDCHHWISLGGNASIEGDNRQNIVKIKTKSAGRQVITLSILTTQGLTQCSKNIDILPNNTENNANPNKQDLSTNIPIEKKESNCDIQVNNYKEVKYSENIVTFFPNVMGGEYKYTYIATYENGDQMSSTEKIPQFPFTKENGIKSVKVKILSSSCLKEFTKSYEQNYWKYF